MALVEKLRRASAQTPAGAFRIVNPLWTVEAAVIAKIPITLACALLSKETSGGLNEWGDDPENFAQGHDHRTGKNWGAFVTKQAYEAYKRQRTASNKQGVGPTQLTDPGLQNDADKIGGAWKPLPNMIIGFAYLKSFLRAGLSLRQGLADYNGGSGQYASTVLEYESAWAKALGVKSIQG